MILFGLSFLEFSFIALSGLSISIFNSLIWGYGFSGVSRYFFMAQWIVPFTFFALFVLKKRRTFKLLKYKLQTLAEALFILYILLSLTLGHIHTINFAGSFNYYLGDLMRWVLMYFGYIYAVRYVDDVKKFINVSKVLVFSLTISVMVGFILHIIQIAFQLPFIRYGHLSVIPITFSLVHLIFLRRSDGVMSFMLAIAFHFLLVLDLLTSLSRVTILLYTGSILGIFLFGGARIRTNLLTVLAALGSVGYVVALNIGLDFAILEQSFDRIKSALDFWNDYSIEGKTDEVGSVLQFASNNFSALVFGHGFGSVYEIPLEIQAQYNNEKTLHHIHFTPVNILFRVGGVNVLLFICFCLSASFLVIKNLKKSIKLDNLKKQREFIVHGNSLGIAFGLILLKSFSIFNVGGFMFGLLFGLILVFDRLLKQVIRDPQC